MRLRAVGTRGRALPNPEGPWATLPGAGPTVLHGPLTPHGLRYHQARPNCINCHSILSLPIASS